MFSKNFTTSIIFIFIFFTYFDKNIIASSEKITSAVNPLRADTLNSYTMQGKQEYPQIYNGINELILKDMPVLIKEDIDKYLNDVSRKITAHVVDSPKPKVISKSKKSKSQDSKKNPNISFDFPNVTLAEFTRFVANLNKKILIGENLLQGNITIKTPKKLTLKRLMKVFQALLNSKGLSYMISGKYMQIYQKSDSEVKVHQINYLKAKDLAKTLQNIFKMSFNVGGRPERIMVNSLDDANCVVVLAPKSRQLEIEKAIKMLDWRRRQVLLEIKVVEITYNNKFGFGITAGGSYQGTSGGIGPSMTTFPNGGTTNTFSPTMPDIPSPYSGFRYDNGQWLFDLEAEQKIGKHKVLTQPKLLTSENQKAEINVGHQQPIQQAQTNMGTSSAGIPASETTVDWKDIGIKVAITPRINANRDVTLDFEMTSTAIVDLITVGSFTNYPVIGQRITKNTSTVMDKHTLVLGGLLKEEKKTQKYKFPFLGDMPMVGWMFTTFQELTENTELILFITPHVIELSEEGTAVTKNAVKAVEDYDKANKGQVIRGIKGERDKSWDIFNIYDYFNDKEYKEEIQQIIPQTWKDPRD
jgi:type II secretory pathway component GspD/PulD (secretin)